MLQMLKDPAIAFRIGLRFGIPGPVNNSTGGNCIIISVNPAFRIQDADGTEAASVKCIFTNCGHTVRYRHRGQTRTAAERRIVNPGHAVRYRHLGQT